jgi:hypothetical protein
LSFQLSALSLYLLLPLSLIASDLKPPAAEGLFALLRIKKAESHYANASRLFLKETVSLPVLR